MATITGLNPFTSYTCTVHAVTISDGPQSNTAAVMTLEAGMIKDHNMMFILRYTLLAIASTPPIIETVTDISSTTVRVTWQRPDMPNGMITSYTITYSVDGVGRDSVNVGYNGEVCSLCMLVCYVYNIFAIAGDANL